MTVFDIAAVLLVLSAAFGLLNHYTLRLPQAIGLVVIALAVSLTLVTISFLFPQLPVMAIVEAELGRIDLERRGGGESAGALQ